MIGKVKAKPIHILLKDNKNDLAVQELQPVACQLMKPLRNHLNEILAEEIIEGHSLLKMMRVG